MLARDQQGRRRRAFELAGIEMPATGDAVDVTVVVIVTARLAFFLAFRESLLPLNHGRRGAFHTTERRARGETPGRRRSALIQLAE